MTTDGTATPRRLPDIPVWFGVCLRADPPHRFRVRHIVKTLHDPLARVIFECDTCMLSDEQTVRLRAEP